MAANHPEKKKQRSPQIGFWMTKASFLQAPLKYHLNKRTADHSLKRILASQIGFPSNPLIFQLGFVDEPSHCGLSPLSFDDAVLPGGFVDVVFVVAFLSRVTRRV